MGLDVTGGAGGVGAALEDLAAAALRLTETADDAATSSRVLLRASIAPDLAAVTLGQPAEAARLCAGLVAAAGPGGLAGEASALVALAALVRAAARGYAAAEAAASALIENAQDALVYALTRSAAPLAAGLVGLDGAGVDLVPAADRLAFLAPWLVDLAGGLEGVVAGPVTPLDYEEALALLSRGASLRGWLTEGGQGVQVRPLRSLSPGGAGPPTALADLLRAQADLGAASAGPGRVRVVEVPQPDGSRCWVVVIPGTQSWRPSAGANPSDLTSDVLLMAGEATLLARGVEQALAAAQARAGRAGRRDPVLLAGHSQGGIAAAALAADPGFRSRQRVTHVVTSGAPVARFRLPAPVTALSLEHVQDPVPRLEGTANPDQPSHLTVTRDLRAEPGGMRRASGAHDARLYEVTARRADHSGSRSLRDWRTGSSGFLAGDTHGSAVVRDFRVERVGPAR